jgi:hypothetical protein
MGFITLALSLIAKTAQPHYFTDKYSDYSVAKTALKNLWMEADSHSEVSRL